MKKLKLARRLWLFRLFGKTTGPLFFGKYKTQGMVTSKTWMSYRGKLQLERSKVWAEDIYWDHLDWSIVHWPNWLFRHEFGHTIDLYLMPWYMNKFYYFRDMFKPHDERYLEKSADAWAKYLSWKQPREYREILNRKKMKKSYVEDLFT